MIENIIDYSLKNKLMVGLMMLTLICWGGYSLVHLPIDAVPDITDNQVQIITVSPNLAANEVEQYITYPIELAVASVPQITQTRSMSRFGLSVVTIVFEDRTDVYWARAQITERLKQVEGDIPPGAGTPELAPVSTGLGEIFQYTIHAKDPEGKKYSLTELRTIQDWIVRRQLLGVEGVADVSSFGGYLKQYQVRVDPNLLKSFSITLDDVFTALEEGNANTGASYIEKENQMFFIRGLGMMMGDFDIENTVITENRGVPVLIKDIGTVEEGYATRYGAMTRNAEGETVGALILMLKGANGSTVIQNVKRRINDVEKSLPENLVIDPFIDREKLVKSAVHTVSTNLIEGALIVLAVLVLFFGSVRSGLVVASVIPLSMLFAFVMMRMFNVSGNLMSLGAIDFGLIVDSTIIIVENILRRFHLNHREGGGHSKQNVVGSATKEMMQSATFGQIIIFVVYIPILALTGIAGKMFQPMALTVTFALIGAFILSLTYVPVASVLFLKEDSEEKANFTHRYLEWMQTRYRKGIEYALDHKAAFLGGSLVLSVGAMFVYPVENSDGALWRTRRGRCHGGVAVYRRLLVFDRRCV